MNISPSGPYYSMKTVEVNPENALLAIDREGNTGLHALALAGNADQLKFIIENNKKINLNPKNNINETPLQCAIKEGKEQVVRLLLESGASIDNLDLDLAASTHCYSIVKLLIEFGVKPSNKTLFQALNSNIDTNYKIVEEKGANRELFDLLLSAGADPTAEVNSYNLLFCLLDHQIDIAEELLSNEEFKLNLNKIVPNNNMAFSPLTRAVFNHQPEYVKLLLKYNAQPNLTAELGSTALHIAFKDSPISFAIVESLLRGGCDPNLKNFKGETPFLQYSQILRGSIFSVVPAVGDVVKLTQLFLEKGGKMTPEILANYGMYLGKTPNTRLQEIVLEQKKKSSSCSLM